MWTTGHSCHAFHPQPFGPNSGSGTPSFFFYADMFSALLCWMAACSPDGAPTCAGFRDQEGACGSAGGRSCSWLWWALAEKLAADLLSNELVCWRFLHVFSVVPYQKTSDSDSAYPRFCFVPIFPLAVFLAVGILVLSIYRLKSFLNSSLSTRKEWCVRVCSKHAWVLR